MFPTVQSLSGLRAWLSFAVMVLIPLAVSVFYYLFLAIPVYESSARVAVRKEGAGSEASMALSMGASSALSVFSDSFIVAEYVKSREAVEGIMETVDLKGHLAKGNRDPFYRFSTDASIEQTIAFWELMVDADFDVSMGIINLRVRAFEPADTVEIANALNNLLEKLVARLSEKSRRETVRFAEAGVAQILKDLETRGEEMRKFRSTNQIVDPRSEVETLNAQTNVLSQDRVKLQTERAVALTLTSSNNPQIQVLDIKIAELTRELQNIRDRMNQQGSRKSNLPELLLTYERLENNIKIANEQYVTALQRLSEANTIAALRGAHLFVFVRFSKPQSPMRPNNPSDILWLLSACLGIWGIYRLTA